MTFCTCRFTYFSLWQLQVINIVYCFNRSIALSGSSNNFISKGSCDLVGKQLNHRQLQFCRRNIDVMNSVKNGASLAVSECQHQFRHRRWNCTTVQFERSPVFGNSANGGKNLFKALYYTSNHFTWLSSFFRLKFSLEGDIS